MSNRLQYGIFQLVVFITILIFIITRILCYANNADSWIWIINYIGMCIALINLLIQKCVNLKFESHKNYKSFKGLTIIIVFILCSLVIPLYMCQEENIAHCLNDVITLCALFFSLSTDIWNYILGNIADILP